MSNNKIYIRMNDNIEETDGQCPSWALAVGYLGVTSSVVLCNFGSAVSGCCLCAEKTAECRYWGDGWFVGTGMEMHCEIRFLFLFHIIIVHCYGLPFVSLCLDSL